MNLDNLNLVELNAQEVQVVVGGNILYWAAGCLAWDIISNWDESCAAFSAGAHARI